MKNIKTLLTFTAVLVAATTAYAAAHTSAPVTKDETEKAISTAGSTTVASTADMAEGEIRQVDMETKKITIKHGVIKNLDMPGMTMVFQVKDLAMQDKVKAGDKVRFTAEKAGGAIVVTDIQPAK